MVEEKLLPFLNNEDKPSPGTFSLDNIKKIMKEVGNPHLGIKTIHVAGTNGKGSVVQFLGHIFHTAGYRTGCYTSPHLKTIHERIQINGTQVSDFELENLIDTIIDILRKRSLRATYFDILTAAAFMYFKKKDIDIAIIETGLGGRLDSTNIIKPLLSIITSISFDHMEFLGDTLTDIAEEKAGVIKAGSPVITCNTENSVNTILETAARQQGVSFHVIGKDFAISEAASSSEFTSFTYQNMRKGCKYECSIISPVTIQTLNAGTALYAVENLFDEYPRLKNLNLSEAISTAKLVGRFFHFCGAPFLLFDPAHNEAGLISLYDSLSSVYKGKNIISVITMMKEKNTHSMIEIAAQSSEMIFYLLLEDKRNYSPDISDPRFHRILSEEDLQILAEEIQKVSYEDTIVIFTGSFRIFETAEKISDLLSPGKFGG